MALPTPDTMQAMKEITIKRTKCNVAKAHKEKVQKLQDIVKVSVFAAPINRNLPSTLQENREHQTKGLERAIRLRNSHARTPSIKKKLPDSTPRISAHNESNGTQVQQLRSQIYS